MKKKQTPMHPATKTYRLDGFEADLIALLRAKKTTCPDMSAASCIGVGVDHLKCPNDAKLQLPWAIGQTLIGILGQL